jgi:alpha-amylase/alpha-mannosidase (GH57 family)
VQRYICIHGHFYQPPRENPWLEIIEYQESAYPYHDWNERINAESYAPNTASRILDADRRILDIVNNYAWMSFNFGPTLLAWMEANAGPVYEAVREADRLSRERFGGHGSALAQAYNHMILPLANRRDKWTQIQWGVDDFRARFGRDPEGMWLPETAVDHETLELLVDAGIRFTVLSPYQARRVREAPDQEWQDVTGARIDPTRAYRQSLASGRSIALFFYDGPISQGIAFEGMLTNGERFAQRLKEAYREERTWPQLVHIATDGETYGHHHAHGDMALAYALHHFNQDPEIELTNYAQYLARHPPEAEVDIVSPSSWSCAHGVERWRSDCGCQTGGQPGWRQTWRRPLRDAFDWLRDALAGPYEAAAGELLRDPWAARDDYVHVVLDRSPPTLDAFLARHAKRPLTADEVVRVLRLLEMQRHLLLMYTSCGWFFTELSGMETVQTIMYAARALQLSDTLFGSRLEEEFLRRLERAPSNIPEHQNGRRVYERFVRPARVDLPHVAGHYALASLFHDYGPVERIGCYEITRDEHRLQTSGRTQLALGRVRVASGITRHNAAFEYVAYHLGEHTLHGGVRARGDDGRFRTDADEIAAAFASHDVARLIRTVDQRFAGADYTLATLFKDTQHEIALRMLEETLEEVHRSYGDIYDRHAPMLRILGEAGTTVPAALRATAGFVVNHRLQRALEEPELRHHEVRALLDEARRERIALDAPGLSFSLRRSIERLMDEWQEDRSDLGRLRALTTAVEVALALPAEPDLWRVQNAFFDILRTDYPNQLQSAQKGEEDALAWVQTFNALGDALHVRVDA